MSVDDLWLNTVHRLLNHGRETVSRNGKVKETLVISETLSNISQTFLLNNRRRLSPMYASAEFLWYMSGTGCIDMIKAYAPQYYKFAENGIAFGAYGYRIKIFNQLNLTIDVLQKYPDSRQALISFWQGSDLIHAYQADHADLPCTMSLQFLIRDDKLHLITTMRSNDAWLGLPYDIFAFTCLQRLIADALNIKYGTYTHQVGNMHLYEKNWKAAEEALVCPTRYSRLIHNWPRDNFHWQKQIQMALCAEGRYRHNLNGIAEHRSLGEGMFYDLVSCCANQFKRIVTVKSPILNKALMQMKKEK